MHSARVPLDPTLRPQVTEDSLVGRRGKPYHPAPGLIGAVNVALQLGRPLLLTGVPGCGKTDFAFAVAHNLGSKAEAGETTATLLESYIRSSTRARDLLYTYDAVRRFGESQHGSSEGRRRGSDPRPYIELRALGEALCSRDLRVVLIDEIDKAPRDLPNDLLRELSQGAFTIPEIPWDEPPEELPRVVESRGIPLRRVMEAPEGASHRPLVVLTSNAERELPEPFLRRCVFWHLDFPEREQLRSIVRDHFEGEERVEDLLDRALTLFERVRTSGVKKKPGTSELLDWVAALGRVYEEKAVRVAFRAFGDVATSEHWSLVPGLECLLKNEPDRRLLLGRGRA